MISSPSRMMTTPMPTNHHHHKGTVLPANTKGPNNSLLFSKGLSEDHKSPNSRLLQLAERTSNPARSHNNKGTSSSSSSHLLSFRNVISPSKSSTSFARRNTSILNSSQSPTSPGEKCAVRQNPKLYTSFSSKSCSKLTKAFIRSDPLKTNIEHLVSPMHNNNKAGPKSPSHSANSGQGVNTSSVSSSSSSSPTSRGGGSGANLSSSDHNSDTSLSSGLSNLITPLKAIHASFHDRSKLSNAFAPRSRLFSQKDKSKSSPKPSPVSRRENHSPDFLEYFGNPCNQLAVNNSQQQSPEVGLPTRNNNNAYSTPDILENVLGVEDNDTNYIILDRIGRRASEDFINRSNNTNSLVPKGGRSHSSSSSTIPPDESITNKTPHSNKSKSPLIISGTPTRHDNHVQISNRNLLRDQNHHPQQNLIPCTTPTVSNLHTDINYNNNRHVVVASPPRNKSKPSPSDTEGGGIIAMNISAMKMSTATPMKISSSAACRAQIVTLSARSSSDEADTTITTTLKEQQQSTKKNVGTAGAAHLNSKESSHNHQNLHLQQQSCNNNDHDHQKVWADYPSTSTSSGINSSNSSKLTESGSKSSVWNNSNYATSTSCNGHGHSVYDDNDECAPVPPPIPKRCSTTTTSSHLLVVSPRCKSTPVPPPPMTFNEMKSVSTTNPVVLQGRNNDTKSARPPPPPPPKRNFTNGSSSNLIVRSEKRLNSLMHSFSFSFGRSKCGNNGCGRGGIYSPLENETIPTPHLNRNRSRSLPKSFLSGNRHRNKGQDLMGRSALPR